MTTANRPVDAVHVLRPDDADFMWVQGDQLYQRAGFEVTNACPAEYRQMIHEAVNNRWLRPVAYVRESEYIWERIQS